MKQNPRPSGRGACQNPFRANVKDKRMTATAYENFLASKGQIDGDFGFAPLWTPDFLFDFQRTLVEWALRKGRAAIFADCGLGKTPMQLCWAENVAEKTGRPVLVCTPLAVAAQTVSEAAKFGIECVRSSDGKVSKSDRIVVTNYERLHHFDASDFAGMVCDESSILKSFEGVRRGEITTFMRKMPYRLLCTATAAPNDFVELGTSSESLGYLGHMDMLNRFFKNLQNTSDTKGRMIGYGAPRIWEGKMWRFKGHAEEAFWKWVTSWARALRRPSDLGFSDERFALPKLIEREHVVSRSAVGTGMLFEMPAISLNEQRAERRRTLTERCERAAELVNTGNPALVWCDLNDEGNLLERLIPDAVQVAGADSDDVKERRLMGFATGEHRVLITKKKIGAWGLNFQHCAHEVYFPSHSYEQYYQSIRRCWRFGQTKPVVVDIITTEGEREVMKNLQRKAAACERMFASLVSYMNESMQIDRSREFAIAEGVPSWL
jgi:hypothetical protein